MDGMNRRSAALLALLLSGCSTYSGQKLGPDATGQQIAPAGIPFRLARPEYHLSRTPPADGEDKPTYTVSVQYEPDPTQLYTLNIKPGMLADPDFNMVLGAGGVLTSTKTTLTEQATPTIKAIGSFSASLVGSLAKGLLDESDVRSILIAGMPNAASCKADSTLVRINPDTLKVVPKQTVEAAITERMKHYNDDAAFNAQFHWRTPEEKLCLSDVRDKLQATVKADLDTRKEEWTKAAALARSEIDKELVGLETLEGLVKAKDAKALNANAAAVAAAAAATPSALLLKQRLAAEALVAAGLAPASAGVTPLSFAQSAATWRAALNETKTRIAAWEYYVTVADGSGEDRLTKEITTDLASNDLAVKDRGQRLGPVRVRALALVTRLKDETTVKALTAIVDVSDKVWRARHLIYLEGETEAVSVSLLRHPRLSIADRKAVETYLLSLRTAQAQTAGTTDLVARAETLRAFIATIRNKALDHGTAPATAEYVTARTELDEVNKLIDAQRAKVIAAAKPPEPKAAPALKDVTLTLVSDTDITASKQPGWDQKLNGQPAPDYVIVIKEAQ